MYSRKKSGRDLLLRFYLNSIWNIKITFIKVSMNLIKSTIRFVVGEEPKNISLILSLRIYL